MDEVTLQVAEHSGLRPKTCKELLDQGWTYQISENKPPKWIAPTADKPDYVPHNEPNCNSECGNMAPHKHGLPCAITCNECTAICHPDCPAYKEGT